MWQLFIYFVSGVEQVAPHWIVWRGLGVLCLLHQTAVINFRPFFRLLCSVLVAVADAVQRRLCSAPGTLREGEDEAKDV